MTVLRQEKSEAGNRSNQSLPVFVFCATCYWCATFFDKIRIPVDNNCPICNTNDSNKLVLLYITQSKSSTFDYDTVFRS